MSCNCSNYCWWKGEPYPVAFAVMSLLCCRGHKCLNPLGQHVLLEGKLITNQYLFALSDFLYLWWNISALIGAICSRMTTVCYSLESQAYIWIKHLWHFRPTSETMIFTIVFKIPVRKIICCICRALKNSYIVVR